MNHAIKLTALAVFAASFAAPAMADKATTKGGFEIKSEDGNFSAKLGGRIHFDGNYVTEEDDLNAAGQKRNSTTDFRRARLSVSGKAYDWTYLFENDFAGQGANNGSGFREMWIGREVLGGQTLRIGQAKPFRGMEELTSSNDITFMERPFATATGIYQRQFTQGLFLNGKTDMVGYGVAVYNNKTAGEQNSGAAGATNSQALGYNGRVYAFPINSDTSTLHFGLSATSEEAGNPTVGAGGFAIQPRLTRNAQVRPTLINANQAFDKQTTIAGEVAFRQGPFTAQAEYALADFSDSLNVGQSDEKVAAYYAQVSYFITDHAKRYNTTRGAFGSPSVKPGAGAIELKARYDMIENKDSAADAEASGYAVGVNYYATSNVRFMVEYHDGKSKGVAGTNPQADISAITARAQFSF
ncbi:MAG: porin [Moraxellaceae bacterium]|nr:porin [Moraxellaceae bacterium]